MKEDLICLIDSCDEYLDLGVVPPKPMNITTKTCQYCAYRSKCRRDK